MSLTFNNPRLQNAFSEFEKLADSYYENVEKLNADILALETYLADKLVPPWVCFDTKIILGFWGDRKRVMSLHPTVEELKPLIEFPLKERMFLANRLPAFVENLTAFMAGNAQQGKEGEPR